MPLPTLPLQSSPFAAALSAVVARLAASLQISPAFVRPVASDNYELVDAEPLMIFVRVYGMRPSDGQGNYQPNMGAGRLARNVSRRLRCYIYTRSGQDTFGSDQFALTGSVPQAGQAYPNYSQVPSLGFQDGGQLFAEELVMNALDDFCPLYNGQNTCLNVVHWIDSSGGPPERKPEKDAGVIRSFLDFEVEYVLAQNPVDPSP